MFDRKLCFFVIFLTNFSALIVARRTARAFLYGNNSTRSFGSVQFSQENENSPVVVSGNLNSLNSSTVHGFHVHVYSVSLAEPICGSAGGHFNPYNVTHGGRTNSTSTRHVGDLGNITTDSNGIASISFNDWIIQLHDGTQSIINRTLIVHEMRDDGGQGGFPDSLTTGNAGSRILCGRIQLVSSAGRFQASNFICFLMIFMFFLG